MLGAVKTGQRISVEFPMRDVTEKTRIVWTEKDGKHTMDFRVRLRGFNVVDIRPHHESVPFFNRPDWRQDDMRWKKVVRFVPNDELVW